ncbi:MULTISPECIES: hypothetical protein [Catenuloplanes]|uniref:Uncharacterized protein n=1 Tax=Catenuloplanes niger TaxID=587534 RepID=A0AAE4CUK6_9ACTN|nr:hypothetical protein [Catenuloplanes niger]MDR7326456.1 hypothetical protein [Catenuloplanes niger]
MEAAEGLRRLPAAPPKAGVTWAEPGPRVDEIDAEGWARIRRALPTSTVVCDFIGESRVVVVVRHGRAESAS